MRDFDVLQSIVLLEAMRLRIATLTDTEQAVVH